MIAKREKEERQDEAVQAEILHEKADCYQHGTSSNLEILRSHNVQLQKYLMTIMQ